MPTHSQRMKYVNDRMKAIGKTRVQTAQLVGKEGGRDLISGSLLIAISLRESGGRNVLGDNGHARGAFQITDWWHKAFLKSVRGCLAAKLIPEATRLNWIPIPGTNAAMRGFCPTWEDGARYTAKLLNGYVQQAVKAKVKRPEDQLAVAIASFNCGFGPARDAFFAGNVDLATTGRDYAADVQLRRTEVDEWLKLHPNWRA